ncbi:6-phosphogluconate dehydrogenase C-terminal domain-like protein [Panus rudis PR-1116 ss-1]|nr:6-phosphogluconate dehydrogenase C-terminal domain-like protein [Panus rudis PR-1116 ss-1]
MSPDRKEVLLIGYGAVGAVCALVLKRSGQARVTVVARSNYEATKANGMHFKSQKFGDVPGWRPDRLCSSISEAADQAYSHVVLTTKAVPDLQRTPELLAPLVSPPYSDKYSQPTYVLIQNGLNTEVDLYRALKELRPDEEPRIINTAAYIFSRLTSPDVVEHTSDFLRLKMGICRSTPNVMTNTPTEAAILSEFGDMLSAGGADITIVPEIQRYRFEKNIWNCVLGPASVLPRYSFQALFRAPTVTMDHPEPVTFPVDPNQDVRPSRAKTASIPASFPVIAENTLPWLYDAFVEVAAVGNALYPPGEDGKPLFSDENGLSILQISAAMSNKPNSSEKLSILVDVEAGRPMEVEVLVGEVVRAGRRLGVPIPRIETLYALMSIIQAQLLYAHSQGKTS